MSLPLSLGTIHGRLPERSCTSRRIGGAVGPRLTSPGHWTVTVETATAHFLVVGGAVSVNNVNYANQDSSLKLGVAARQLTVASSKRYSTKESTAPSNPWIFASADSMT